MSSLGIKPKIRERFQGISDAAAGDLVLTITPATVNRAATAAVWDRDVYIRLENAAGDLHSWYSGSHATTLSIADTSVAGTASIASTTLSFKDGIAVIKVSGDAAAWLAAETDTLTVANITVMGVTVTGGTSVQTFV